MALLLVGDSQDEQGRDAIALAAVLAPLLQARVVGIQVVGDPEGRAGGDGPPEGADDEIHVGRSPARVLHELASSRHPTMLVVGSSRRAGPGRVFPGGVTERLLQGGPCPIAVAPLHYARGAPGEPRVIGVAFDGSPESRQALDLAAELATAATATLRVISVYPAPEPQSNPALGPPSAHEQMRDTLREVVGELPASLRAEPRFRHGDVVDVLTAESELGLDLLVMGSRGYGPVLSVLLGSVSEQTMRRARCPVVIAPRGAHEAPSEATD